jgi:thiosulfate/3-mercaptopyruvate sulfurtransferase
MTDPLVSASWLAERRGSADLIVVDATMAMVGVPDAPKGAELHRQGHIPGAVFFDVDEVADKTTNLPHMLLGPDAFAEAAGRLGLRRDATIVAYDAHGMFSAPRLWWTLRTMGYEQVFVLDGGLKAWRTPGGAVETGDVVPRPTTVAPAFRPELVRDLDAVRSALEDGPQIVDARSAGRFRGEEPEPRAHLRRGHMPGARNVPWTALLNPDSTLKSPDELEKTFAAAGVDLARPLITTCGSGVTASVLALGLARLGRTDVAVYDGSWTEWGGRDDTPVVTGP